MSAIICLSSDDDDERIKKKLQEGSSANKRKLSLPVSSVEAKKRKLVDEKNISGTSIREKESSASPSFSKLGVTKQCNSHITEDSNRHVTTTMRIKPKLIEKERIPIPEPTEDIFQEFLDVCKKKRNDENTQKILSKLSRYYDQLDDKFQKNEEFRIFLKQVLQKVKTGVNDKFYFYIEEVLGEIKLRIKNKSKKSIKSQIDSKSNDLSTENKVEDSSKTDNKEENEEEQGETRMLSKDERIRVMKLEKAISKCKDKIKELESQEVNFSDDEDSAYLQEDRYKRKLIELYKMLSDIVDDKVLKKEIYKKFLKRKDISGEMTGIPKLDDALIRLVNNSLKKVNKLNHIIKPNAIPDFLKVPDYQDILKVIEKHNDEQDLDFSAKRIEVLAKTSFKTLANHLKKKRARESSAYFSSFLEDDMKIDPALKNPELLEELKKNQKEGDHKLNEIFKKFVDKQEGLTTEDLKLQEMNSDVSEESEDETSKTVNKGNTSADKNQLKKSEDQSMMSLNLIPNNDNTLLINKDKNLKINVKVSLQDSDSLKEKINDEENSFQKHKSKKEITTEKNNDKIDSSQETIGSPNKFGDLDKIIVNKNESKTKEKESFQSVSLDNDVEINYKNVEETERIEKNEKNLENSIASDDIFDQEDIEIVEIPIEIEKNKEATKKSPDEIELVETDRKRKPSFIKVRSFAKPPASWKDVSPEKSKQVLRKVSPTEFSKCIDLTEESDEQCTVSNKKKDINPMAINRRTPVKNVVVVKNVVNNYNVSYPSNSSANRHPLDKRSPLKSFSIKPTNVKRTTTAANSPDKKSTSGDRGQNILSTKIFSRKLFTEIPKDKTSKDSTSTNKYSLF